MKKKKLNKLAILGITSGLITLNHTAVNASQLFESENGNTHLFLAAEHKCGGPHGCPAENANKSKASSSNNSKSNLNPANLVAEKSSEEGNLGYHLYTEDELLLELNENGIALYKSLDSEGKALARLVASQRCDHTNECKGLNACKTDDNDCAGKGKCKGQSKCAFSDKNLAIKAVADKLAKKRIEANKGNKK